MLKRKKLIKTADSKQCTKCDQIKPFTEFGFNKITNGYSSMCRVCHRKYNANAWAYRYTPEVRKEMWRKQSKAYQEKWPEKIKAKGKVRYAIRTGKLIKQPCEICGEINSQAHHYLGYAEEHWLDVKWLCKLHHMENHRLHKTELIHKEHILKIINDITMDNLNKREEAAIDAYIEILKQRLVLVNPLPKEKK